MNNVFTWTNLNLSEADPILDVHRRLWSVCVRCEENFNKSDNLHKIFEYFLCSHIYGDFEKVPLISQ